MFTKRRRPARLVAAVALALTLTSFAGTASAAMQAITIHTGCKPGSYAEVLYWAPQGVTQERWTYTFVWDSWGAPIWLNWDTFICRSRNGCLVKSYRQGNPILRWDAVQVSTTNWVERPRWLGARCQPS